MARSYGAYMLQPTKNELRANLRLLQDQRDAARAEVANLTAELDEMRTRLDEAYRLLGRNRVEASLAEHVSTE